MIGPGEKLLLFEDNYFSDPLEPRHQRGESRHSKEEGKRREGGWRGGGGVGGTPNTTVSSFSLCLLFDPHY